MNQELELKLKSLPNSPGCYLMKSGGEVIYVGKAKNLKNRVRQYFQSSKNHTPKVLAMVEKVDDFDIMLVDSELEALILECNLIKLNRPRYNILLKDDKHYPYIRIDVNEAYPRVALVRKQEKDGAKYFGPYKGATVVREVMDVVRMVFPIRTCAKDIKPGGSARPCVHHQIGQCLAPCAGMADSAEYHKLIERVMEFLSGRFDPVLSELKRRMEEAASEMRYERAALNRDRIRAVEAVMQKQRAISTAQGDRDVIAIAPEADDALIELMFIRSGRLLGSEQFTLEGAGYDLMGEALTQFLLQYYGSLNEPPQEILISCEMPERGIMEELLSELSGRRTHIITPMRGEKAKLVGMAKKNLRDAIEKRRRKMRSAEQRTGGAVRELQAALGLQAYPRRIEGYDISNTLGALSVGSMVVMIDGVCVKKEYRHFRIKTVEGANDFASMKEVLTRRLRHGMKELTEGADENSKFADLPDLILIDGGRGQLNAALEAMAEVGVYIPAFGLAKRIDEIILPNAEESLLLDRHSSALHLIERLRDEAHRFAISHHRKLRGKKSVGSTLENVSGVGEKRRKAILNHFKTAEALRNASLEDIKSVPGLPADVAANVFAALHAKPE